MKVAVLSLLVILGVILRADVSSGEKYSPETSLEKDLQHIGELIPLDKIKEIVNDQLEKDMDFYRFAEFVRSGGTRKFIKILEKIPAYVDVRGKLLSIGLDIDKRIGDSYDFLAETELELPSPPASANNCCGNKGADEMVDKICALIPRNKILSASMNLILKSMEFSIMVDVLKSKDIKNIRRTLQGKKEYKDLIAKYMEEGVFIERYVEAGIDIGRRITGFKF